MHFRTSQDCAETEVDVGGPHRAQAHWKAGSRWGDNESVVLSVEHVSEELTSD